LPVLAETALEIASDSGDGKGFRPGEKMVERFFFDGVDVLSDELSIGMRIENAPSVFPDVADAKFSIGDQTMVATQEAGDLMVFLFLV